ncbi:MAG: hypothetical protein V7606_3709, partial [Burkholderiales bacterium]
MDMHSKGRGSWADRLHWHLDQMMHFLSTYALSFLIICVTLAALFTWQKHNVASPGKPVPIRILEDASEKMTLEQALAQLQNAKPVLYQDTKLSEKPFWFTFSVTPPEGSRPLMAELPSRHGWDATCWDARTLYRLGHARRGQFAERDMSVAKAGYSLALDMSSPQIDVVCRGLFVGPARVSVALWHVDQLVISSQEFFRDSGLLDGGLVVLAVFMLITALINRESTYLLFAAWLIVSVRMAALSAGWDTQWLGRTVPHEWLVNGGRSLTMTVYYVLTIALFKALFRQELSKIGYTPLLRYIQWTCVPLLVFSTVVPFGVFLPVYWPAAFMLAAILIFLLVRTLMIAPSRTAIWYCASLAIAAFAAVAEILGAATGYKSLSGALNSVTAALSSSLLATVAVAEQIRTIQKARLDAQAELEHTYEAMPIGLFTLDLHGRFQSANPALTAMLGSTVMAPGHNSWEQYFSEGSWPLLHRLVHLDNDGELEIT